MAAILVHGVQFSWFILTGTLSLPPSSRSFFSSAWPEWPLTKRECFECMMGVGGYGTYKNLSLGQKTKSKNRGGEEREIKREDNKGHRQVWKMWNNKRETMTGETGGDIDGGNEGGMLQCEGLVCVCVCEARYLIGHHSLLGGVSGRPLLSTARETLNYYFLYFW